MIFKRSAVLVHAACMTISLCLALSSAAGTGPLVLIYTSRTTLAPEGSGMSDSPAKQSIRLEISRSRHQLGLYRGGTLVKRYPVAVGRTGWETPLGEFHVLQMIEDPEWKHPLTGEIFRAGEPGNELGHYWIGFWTNGTICVGFHGTPHPQTVGKSVSHGCIRMYDKDIEELFTQVELGTLVTVAP